MLPAPPAPVSATKQHFDHLPPSQLTPSCSRCRAKKLKCQFEDRNPHAACTNCLVKGLGNACHRDLRTPRGKKRARVGFAGQATIRTVASSSLSSTDTRAAEIAALKTRLRLLEGHKDARSNSYTAPPVAPPASTNMDALHAATILGAFSQRHGRERNDGSDGDDGGVGQPARKHSTRRILANLLRQAKSDAYATDLVVVEELLSVFLYRANHNIGHIIYGPGIHRAADVFLSSSVEQMLSSVGSDAGTVGGGYQISFADDPASLAVLMLVLCIGFDFHPEQPAPGKEQSQGFLAVQTMRRRGIDPTKTWYAIARAAFDIEHSFRLSTLAAMQAGCLFLARGQETRAWIRMLQRVAIASAQDFNLHRLGSAQRTADMSNDDFVCLETAVRIWNYLVLRDWCALSSALAEGAGAGHVAGYQIHPNHFTTRKPLNLDDNDLDAGLAFTRPSEEWTFVSYFLVQLEMADIVRQAMDLYRAEQTQYSAAAGTARRGLSPRSVETVQRMAVEFITSLPPDLSLHSHVTTPSIVPIERWTLHQQLFHFMMALCRTQYAVTLASPSVANRLGAAPGDVCRHLAELVIRHHDRVRYVCPVINGFHVHFAQLFNACLTLMLDLITHQAAPMDRNRTRETVCQTLDQLHDSLQSASAGESHDFEQQRGWQQRGLEMLAILLSYENHVHSGSKIAARLLNDLAAVSRSIVKDVERHARSPASDSSSAASELEPRIHPAGKQRPIPQETMLPVVLAWPSDALYMLTANGTPSQGIQFPVASGVSKQLRLAASGQPRADLTLHASESSFQLSTAAVLEWAMSFDEAIKVVQSPVTASSPPPHMMPSGLTASRALPAPPPFPAAMPHHALWNARPQRSAPHLYHYST